MLSILNDFAVSSSSKDQVVIQRQPVTLNLLKVGTVAIVMGLISALEVWGLVHSVIKQDPDVDHFWGLKPKDGIEFTGCEAAAYCFLALLVTLQLDLIAARSPKPFFWFSTKKDEAGHFLKVPPPGTQVLVTVAITLTIGTLIAILWTDNIVVGSGFGMEGMGWRNGALVWAWGILWFIIIDLTKFFVLTLFGVSKNRKEEGVSWKAFFTSILALPYDEDEAQSKKVADLRMRRSDLQKYDPAESVRGRADSSVQFPISLGLASIAMSNESGEDQLLSYQDRLLAVESLQHDPNLLRLIAEMHFSIGQLQKRVDELEGKKSK